MRAAAKKASLIVVAAISGCAAPSPFDTPPGMQPPANSMSAPAMSAPSPAQSMAPAMPSSGPTLTPPSVTSGAETYLPSTEGLQSPSAWNQPAKQGYLAASGAAIASSLHKTKASLTSALQIQPKVIPASDPTSLNTQPANAGQASADLHYHAARLFESKNSLEAATAHYRDALIQTPNDPRLVLSYARLQDRIGNFAEAEAAYQRAIALAPHDGKAYNDLAMCHNRQGKYDSAIAVLQQAIQRDPTNSLYHNNHALVLVDSGRPADALSQLVAVHGEAAAHYNVGYMLLEKNRTEEARQYFTKAIELDPQLQPAQQMLEYVQSVAQAPAAESAAATRLPAVDETSKY